MNSFNSNASESNDSDHDDRLTTPEKGDLVSVESKTQLDEWAENWFAGNACCPVCGGDDMQIGRTRGDESGRIEDWRCASRSCGSRWRVELRESALGIYRDADGIQVDWYERTADAPTFRILIEEGIVTAVRTPQSSAGPDPFP